jgi:Ion channel
MLHSNWMGILSFLLVGFAATLGTMVIHGLVVHTIIIKMRRDLQRGWLGARLWVNLTFVTGTTLLTLTGHILEVALWALVFDLFGGVANFSAALYCSAGNYTTVGSGGVVLSPHWKLLGPLEAAVGLLMFGTSTALIFAVIERLIHARLAGASEQA